jgi:hypothetical protein
MALAMKQNKPLDPEDLGLLGPETVVAYPGSRANFFKKSGFPVAASLQRSLSKQLPYIRLVDIIGVNILSGSKSRFFFVHFDPIHIIRPRTV